MAVTEAVGALEVAARSEGHPLLDEEFLDALGRVIPFDGITLSDLEPAASEATNLPLAVVEGGADVDQSVFWDHFWDSLPCNYTLHGGASGAAPRCTTDFYDDVTWRATGMYVEYFRPSGIEWDLVMPLPSRKNIARRLVFFRAPGPKFGDTETSAARVLRPHVVEALRKHSRMKAVAALTPRQRELVQLCALGLDNTRIARCLDVSPATVRKHLENVFARLGVQSRTEAVAVTRPDLSWA